MSESRVRSWIRRRWKPYLAVIVGLQLFVYFKGCASDFLLAPSTDHHASLGAVSRTVRTDDGTIEIWTERSKACTGREPEAFVLEFCGNGERAEDITWFAAERWGGHPVEVWCMNYPGYGGSTGPAKLHRIPPAALATYDALKSVAGDRPIFIEATSIGTTCGLYVASKRSAAALILQNPPPLRRLIMQRHGWWNLWLLATPVALQIPSEMNSTGTAPGVAAPACFLLSDRDDIVPPNYHQMVVDAYAGPKTVIRLPNAGHNSPVDAGSEKILRTWIDQQWTQTFPTSRPAH
jgi:hypothetical protein